MTCLLERVMKWLGEATCNNQSLLDIFKYTVVIIKPPQQAA